MLTVENGNLTFLSTAQNYFINDRYGHSANLRQQSEFHYR